MIEKVNPYHVDKIADRIAGAIVDLGYTLQEKPKIATEVLIGHGQCHIIIETSVAYQIQSIEKIVERIAGNLNTNILLTKQDIHLSKNQQETIKCGDNGIFKGVPITGEDRQMSSIARSISAHYNTDGKYILDGNKLIICQSHAEDGWLEENFKNAIINPLGNWTGGTYVDTGATNRKLGSDMGESVTGGGLHGKDLSKADVSINIMCFLLAQERNKVIKTSCAIGDTMIEIDGEKILYEKIVNTAKEWIDKLGGFEKLAEWGLF